MGELYNALINDIADMGISLKSDVRIILKPYSKNYLGHYDTIKKCIIVYVFRDESLTEFFSYKELLTTLIHECIHYIQWSSENYVRKRGIMHDVEFKWLFSKYSPLIPYYANRRGNILIQFSNSIK